ncbi:MAG: prepilin peptidase [Anaerolineae bacterium]|nr:prepilin peptidase [Phycisphaerae bacterium]
MSSVIYYAPLIGLLLWAAMVDMRARRVPNWISFGLAFSGIMLSLLPWGHITVSQAALGLLVGFALPFALYLMGAVGAGDVKLVAGVGAWIGPLPVLFAFACAAVVGMFLAIGMSIQQGRVREVLRNSLLLGASVAGGSVGAMARPVPVTGASSRQRTLPFAVAIASATIVVVVSLRVFAAK